MSAEAPIAEEDPLDKIGASNRPVPSLSRNRLGDGRGIETASNGRDHTGDGGTDKPAIAMYIY
jgi:hypothetical protein